TRRLWPIIAGGAVVLALLIVVGLLVGGVFKVKTKNGTIVLENLPTDADVLVDGEKATVTWGDGKKAEISVKPGTRMIEAVQNGTKVIGEQIEIEDGGRKILTAQLARETPRLAESLAQAPSDGFVLLFNGKDLTGWDTHAKDQAKWEVKD